MGSELSNLEEYDHAALEQQPKLRVAFMPVAFKWYRNGGRVIVAGTFNDWRKDVEMYQWPPGSGNFCAVVELPMGVHEYKFCVLAETEYDQDLWLHDPDKLMVPDKFGGYNNLIYVNERHIKAQRYIDVQRMFPKSRGKDEVGPDGAAANPPNPVANPPDDPENTYDLPALQHQLQKMFIRKYNSSVSGPPALFNHHVSRVHLDYCFGAVSDDITLLASTHTAYNKHSTEIFYQEPQEEPPEIVEEEDGKKEQKKK